MNLDFKNWTRKQKKAYIKRWQVSSGEEIRKHYNISQRTVTAINKFLGLKMKSGFDAEGNPIKKSYRTRKDAYPVGTIVRHYHKVTKKRLPLIITEEGRIRLHLYNWKMAGNTIPEGYVLGFKDLNPENCELDNLVLKTRGGVLNENRAKRQPVEKKNTRKKDKGLSKNGSGSYQDT